MADATTVTQSPRRRRWPRRLAVAAAVLVVLIIGFYFVATSAAFFKAVILPRVGSALNANVTVADASIHPFSEVTLRDFKIEPRGAQPLFSATQISAHYSLWAIMHGQIDVQDVTVDSPVISLVVNADGTSNLDPLTKGQPAKPAAPAQPSKPPQINVRKVALNNATIRQVTNLKGGGHKSLELSGVNVTLSDLKNGSSGKLSLSAAIAMENVQTVPPQSATLQAKAAGDFTFDLTSDLKPGAAKGDATFTVNQATGAFAEFATFAAKLNCEASPTEVKQLALSFTKGGVALGQVRVSGPLDAAKSEGKLSVEVLSLDRRVLNLAGAMAGLDFGTTTINSTNQIELANGGTAINAAGRVDVARFQVTRQGLTTPTLDLGFDYSVSVDNTKQSAVVKSFNLVGTENQQPLLQGGLTSPMAISWGSVNTAMGDAALNLTLTNLNLADWRAFTGGAIPAGSVGARLSLGSQHGGQHVTFDVDSQVQNLAVQFGSNQLSQLAVHLTARGTGTDMIQFDLSEYRFDLAQQGQPLVTASGTGAFNATNHDAQAQLAVQAPLANLLNLFPQPDLSVTSGTVAFTGHVASRAETRTATGNFALTDFTGRSGNMRFNHFGSAVDFEVGMKGDQLDIRKASGNLHQDTNPGGRFDITGNCDIAKKAGQFNLTLADFNQNGLRPFLESALGDKKLVSVAINGTATANCDASGAASVKADVKLANLVVSDPQNQIPSTPLEAGFKVDTALNKQVAKVNLVQLTLTPTDRAKNQLGLTGTVDFSNSNAITGNLKLASDALDVTRYFELFAGNKPATQAAPKPAAAPSTAPAVAAAPPTADTEPPPIKLPVTNFVADVNIGQFYLREVNISNLLTTVKLNGGHVVVQPCQLALNGAPVSANVDADLGVPGYKYNVTFNANKVPLAPFVNSFQPDRKGQVGGVFVATAQISGAGITGASLQKNLTGQFDVVATNLNLSLANVRSPILSTLVNVVVGIPDIINNPTAVVGNLLSHITGAGSKTPGWADQFTAAPIQVVSARGTAGNGLVTLQQAVVQSAAFQAGANGTVNLDKVLTNSAIQIPITVSLRRDLADKVGLVSAGTPTNVTYAALPDFLKMKGTVGKPSADVNKLVLVELAAKSGLGVGGKIGNAGGRTAGGIVNTIEGLGSSILGGRSTTQPPGTNTTTSTNKPPAQQQRRGLLDILGVPK